MYLAHLDRAPPRARPPPKDPVPVRNLNTHSAQLSMHLHLSLSPALPVRMSACAWHQPREMT